MQNLEEHSSYRYIYCILFRPTQWFYCLNRPTILSLQRNVKFREYYPLGVGCLEIEKVKVQLCKNLIFRRFSTLGLKTRKLEHFYDKVYEQPSNPHSYTPPPLP